MIIFTFNSTGCICLEASPLYNAGICNEPYLEIERHVKNSGIILTMQYETDFNEPSVVDIVKAIFLK
jgi:hypothetical protein